MNRTITEKVNELLDRGKYDYIYTTQEGRETVLYDSNTGNKLMTFSTDPKEQTYTGRDRY